jgi:hypothetical protein
MILVFTFLILILFFICFCRRNSLEILTKEESIDMFSLSVKWFKRVNKEDKNAIFPELIWDATPKSSASQVHTHFQASVGLIGYNGVMRRKRGLRPTERRIRGLEE